MMQHPAGPARGENLGRRDDPPDIVLCGPVVQRHRLIVGVSEVVAEALDRLWRDTELQQHRAVGPGIGQLYAELFGRALARIRDKDLPDEAVAVIGGRCERPHLDAATEHRDDIGRGGRVRHDPQIGGRAQQRRALVTGGDAE
jgi:hypothetical protein